MNKLTNLIENETLFLYDQGIVPESDHFSPFTFTDTLTTFSGENKQALIHFWQLDRTMILGMKDLRVPDLASGLTSLKNEQYHIVVRNSGGLGVIADDGVLNVSLILPNASNEKVSIDTAYTLMWQWLQATFADCFHPIDAFEIETSYCPGTFDLSIHGKKFAGIAQRRVKQGIAVMIYLGINGNQQQRGETVRRFYQNSLHEQFGQNGYPAVNPSIMSTLSELLHLPLTVNEVKDRLLATLTSGYALKIDSQAIFTLINSPWFQKEQQTQQLKMVQRNQAIQ